MCSLTRDGVQWSAKTGSTVTVKLIANVTNIVAAQYNKSDLQVKDNSVSFTVVTGTPLLLLILAGAKDTVEVVEDCGGGKTQHMVGYKNDFRPAIGFIIVGS